MTRVLITSGPTREPLDDVRFLSNSSSGRMGALLAAEALSRGYDVDVVSGPVEQALPAATNVVSVETTREMLEACRDLHPFCDVVIGAAAVCDYRPAHRLASKRARDNATWTVELVPNPDILATLGQRKGERIHAGFALESVHDHDPNIAVTRAREKLERKHLDWIVLNPVSTIGAESSEFCLIPAVGDPIPLGSVTKAELARALLNRLVAQR